MTRGSLGDAMIVSDVRVEEADGYELSGLVTFEQAPTGSVRVWFRMPAELEAPLRRGDAFFAGLVVSCMALDENLTIEAPLSAELVAAARDNIMPVLGRWYPRLKNVEIRFDEEPGPQTPETNRTISTFSGGLDSWYTAFKNRDRLDALLTIRGMECSPDNEARWRVIEAHVQRCAHQLGTPLLAVATNLRQIGLKRTRERLAQRGTPFTFMERDCYFGAFLVAAGLSLRPNFDRLVVAAGGSWEQVVPHGSHPLMEPKWSTSSMSVELDGLEADRIDKMERLGELYPEALRQLRVCTPQTGNELNCGHCMKCLRTMAELRSAELQELATSFPVPLDLELIRRALFTRNLFWRQIVDRAAASGDTELRNAIDVFMGDKFYWRRFLDNLGRHTKRLLGRR